MAEDAAQTPKGHEGHLFFFSRLEPHTGSGRNVETHTACLFAIERQRAIDFKEVVVASDLNGTVAGVAYEESYLRTATQLDSTPTEIQVVFQYQPSYPLNYVTFVFSVNTSTGNVTAGTSTSSVSS